MPGHSQCATPSHPLRANAGAMAEGHLFPAPCPPWGSDNFSPQVDLRALGLPCWTPRAQWGPEPWSSPSGAGRAPEPLMPRSRQVAICLLRLAVGGTGGVRGAPTAESPARSPETKGAWSVDPARAQPPLAASLISAP